MINKANTISGGDNMSKEDKPKEEKGAFLTDIRFVTDSFDVFEVAEELDEVEEDHKEENTE